MIAALLAHANGQQQQAELVTCPCCEGDGVIGWNHSSPYDPRCDESTDCPLCAGDCTVTAAAAEEWLDRQEEAMQP